MYDTPNETHTNMSHDLNYVVVNGVPVLLDTNNKTN